MAVAREAGRLDEAERSIHAGPWTADEIPFTLQGRLAWLLAVRGDLPGGMKAMRSVLAKHADYAWGWDVYGSWAEKRADTTERRRASAELMRLQPRQPDPCCVAGEAELSAGDEGKAIELFRQALSLDANSAWAAHRLLDTLWQKRRVPELISEAQNINPTGTTGLIRDVYLALASAHQGNQADAGARLTALASQPDSLGPMLGTIEDFFANNATARPLLQAALTKTAVANTIGPSFAVLWLREQAKQGQWQCWMQFMSWRRHLGTRLDATIAVYLDLIGEARAGLPHVANLCRQHRDDLTENAEIWGKVGYALASSSGFTECIEWLSPKWRRPDAEAWTLWNLALSYRVTDQRPKAAEVSLHVVTNGMRDNTWSDHTAVAAFERAMSGFYLEAEAILRERSAQNTDASTRLLAACATALCKVMPAPGSEGKQQLREFLVEAKAISKEPGMVLSNASRADYADAVAVMSKHAGAWIMPWQKIAGPAKAARAGGGSGNQTGRLARIGILVAVLGGLRMCAQSDRPQQPPRDPFPARSKPSPSTSTGRLFDQ